MADREVSNTPSLFGRISEAFSGDAEDKKAKPTAGAAKKEATPKEEGPGFSTLSSSDYAPTGGLYTSAGGSSSSAPSSQPTVVITDDRETPQEHPASRAPETGRIASSGISMEQQIAALEKLYAVDTTEAMKIKADWEKANAHSGNMGIMSALASAVGLGLGTYGPQSHRIGAGLVGLASGLASNEQQQALRQEKLDNLKMKIAEMEQSPHKKAVETIAEARAKAATRKEKLTDDIQLEIAKGNIRKSVDAAKAAGKGTDTAELKEVEIRAKAINDIISDIKLPPGSPKFNEEFDKRVALYVAQNPRMAAILEGVNSRTYASGLAPTATSTGPSRGRVLQTGFTAYQ